jgi:hypothetical protein
MTAKEVSDKIEEAINQVISEFGDYREGDLLGDWVLVAHTSNPDKDKGGSYNMIYSNGDIATYKAKGLLSTAMVYLDLGLMVNAGEDEDE